ncbi:MAG TPA: DUF1385 domain-containing protein [Baekduia sp.]|uniref:DUF1385 domain-containing protein n=1 Tax=Baekduia sp. TaxID=2600305 RepID=UPI002B9CF4BA|nr:DUF1385 domain-containing protein [Baekduia sp.]HMJ33873.1 DUF1385 domain-containing protein [Baekduia sp.]
MSSAAEQSAAPEPLRLGGMALRNGLLVHGPTHWAAAVRRTDGTIAATSGRKPRLRGPLQSVPGARGVIRLGEAMVVIPLVKRALPEAKLPWQDRRLLGAAAATSLATAVLRRRMRGTGGEVALAGLSLLPSLMALGSGDLAAYHGVEHKAISAYERGGADAREAAKEHDRCGSHLMAPMLASNIAGTALLKRAVDKPGALAGAAVSLASVGLAVEVFAWSERHESSIGARLLRRPGYELQRVIGTREPTETQLDVGRAALAEILRAEGVAPAG